MLYGWKISHKKIDQLQQVSSLACSDHAEIMEVMELLTKLSHIYHTIASA